MSDNSGYNPSAYDDSYYHNLPPLEERTASILKIFYKHCYEGWKKPPQKLSDDDIYELSKILDELVKSHSKNHKAAPDMLVHFIEEIFFNWSVRTATTAPALPDGLPYDDTEYRITKINRFGPRDEKPPGVTYDIVKIKSTLRFNVETRSISLQIETTDDWGEKNVCQVTSLEDFGGIELMREMLNELRDNILDALEIQCAERAIQYARHYLHQTKAKNGQVSPVDYEFPQLSDLFAEAPLLLFGERRAPYFFQEYCRPREDE